MVRQECLTYPTVEQTRMSDLPNRKNV